MSDWQLTGLDGSNPLAFLAALGVLVALDEARGAVEPRISWRLDGTWRPWLHASVGGREELVRVLAEDRERCAEDPALRFEYAHGGKRVADVKPSPEDLHERLEAWAEVASPDRRRTIDWFASFVSEGGLDNNGASKPSALHFTAGQQKFLGAARQLAAEVGPGDIEAAVFGPWAYDSKLPVMGWDNTESRDYALRATNPSTDKKLGNPGADWLALRGLMLLPTAPLRGRQRTACVVGGWKTGQLRWPLWTVPSTRAAVGTLLVADRLPELSAAQRSRLGLGVVFAASIRRSDQGGYGSVTPARVV